MKGGVGPKPVKATRFRAASGAVRLLPAHPGECTARANNCFRDSVVATAPPHHPQ